MVCDQFANHGLRERRKRTQRSLQRSRGISGANRQFSGGTKVSNRRRLGSTLRPQSARSDGTFSGLETSGTGFHCRTPRCSGPRPCVRREFASHRTASYARDMRIAALFGLKVHKAAWMEANELGDLARKFLGFGRFCFLPEDCGQPLYLPRFGFPLIADLLQRLLVMWTFRSGTQFHGKFFGARTLAFSRDSR